MRTTFVTFGSICALVTTSCKKPETPTPEVAAPEQVQQQSRSEEPAPAPAPVAAAATPPPAAPTPAATPVPSHLAPEGVFYLTRTVSVETADGLIGLPPGTQAVKQPDGRFLADGNTVELQPAQITNDLRVARSVMTADQTAQLRIRQAMVVAPVATHSPEEEVAPPAPEVAAVPQTAPQENGRFAREFVDPVARNANGVQASTNINAKHTRTGEGYLWQKSPDGQWWVAVKPLKGEDYGYRPPNKRVR